MKQTKQDKIKIENTLVHFPDDISEEINDYVINDVLLHSRYIFTTRKGRKQYGFCTHCKNEFEPVYRLKHKTKTTCPNCKSKCKVQVAGYSRKYMSDNAYFVYYEKSIANNEAVIARGFDVTLDYSGDYKNVKPQYKIEARYLFEMGNPVFIKSNHWWNKKEEKRELRRSVFTLFKLYGFMGVPVNKKQTVSVKSIKKAVAGTQFQYSEWDKYPRGELTDYTEYLALYARYPQIEYLMKLGFREFVERKVDNATNHRTINWNGKTLDKVLKIDKQHVKEAVENARKINPYVLYIYQKGRRDGSNFTIKEAIEITSRAWEHDILRLVEYSNNTNLRKLVNYLNKQTDKDELENEETDPEGDIGNQESWPQAMRLLSDYWDGCRRLNLDIGRDMPKYPNNLNRLHDNVYRQIKFKEDKELDEKIKVRAAGLIKYEYENEHFFIMPFSSTKEIIQEGKALKHCVGGYSKKYAEGSTDLLAIRRHDAPDEPFYTMEVTDGQVQQYYGYGNNQKIKKSKEIIEFVESFKRDILKIDEREIAS